MEENRLGLVSVIIPTYNRSVLLGEAIESIINQTYRPIECIIVDDGSSDNTKEVVEKFIEKNDYSFVIKYIPQKNAGAQVARNTGTAAASGAFIQYLDSDDILYRGKIQHQVNYLLQHKDCDGVFGDWQVGSVGENETIIAHKSEDLIAQMLTGRCIHTLSFLMRLPIVKKIGDWDVMIRRNQEIDFHLRGILAGGNFEYQSCLCGLWREHTGERIVSSRDLQHTFSFFEKWQIKLKEQKLLTPSLSEKLVSLYRWLITANSNAPYAELLLFHNNVKKLQPSFRMFESGKYLAIARLSNEEKALRLWHKHQKRNGSR